MSIAEKFEVIADEVYKKGRQDEYDTFWDAYQDYGNRVYYDSAFSEGGDTASWFYGTTYRPKYPMKPITADSMYYATRLPYEAIKDVDYSNCTKFYRWGAYSSLKQVGVMDMRKATNTGQAFIGSNSLHTIDKIISAETTPYFQTFDGLKKLENITFEGTIGQDISFKDSPLLTVESMIGNVATEEQIANGKNILELNGTYYYGGILIALRDNSTTGTTNTLTLGSTNLAKLTDAQKAVATEKGWTLA